MKSKLLLTVLCMVGALGLTSQAMAGGGGSITHVEPVRERSGNLETIVTNNASLTSTQQQEVQTAQADIATAQTDKAAAQKHAQADRAAAQQDAQDAYNNLTPAQQSQISTYMTTPPPAK